VNAKDEARPALLKPIIQKDYPSLFKPPVHLTSMTAGQFDEHMRQEYGVTGSTVDTFVDASCGPGGECLCDELEDATFKTLKPIGKTFTIKGLTEGADSLTPRCTSFDITITVTVAPVVFDGRCFALDGGDF
jgi:hypothetical protein